MNNKIINFTVPIYYTQEFKTKKDKTWLVGLNNYRNWHYMLNNKVKQHYHELVQEAVRGSKLSCVRLNYRIYAKRKGIDGHNIRSIVEKFVLDGLVEVGVIKDDSTEFVRGTSSEFYIDKDNPRMEIEVVEIER